MSSLFLAVLLAYEANKSHFAAKDIQVKHWISIEDSVSKYGERKLQHKTSILEL